MKKNFFPSNGQLEKISFFALPLVTILFCLISGLWWLSNDLLMGVICLVVFTAFVIDYGVKALRHKASRKYYCWVFFLPWTVAVILFSYGFLR
jgi:hypothetical protein